MNENPYTSPEVATDPVADMARRPRRESNRPLRFILLIVIAFFLAQIMGPLSTILVIVIGQILLIAFRAIRKNYRGLH